MIQRRPELTCSSWTLVDALRQRAETLPDYEIYRFVDDDGVASDVTFGELDQQARRIATALAERYEPGDRVLLIYPPGPEFVAAFLGCLYAGILAVPLAVERPRRPSIRLAAVAENCQPRALLSTARVLETLTLPDAPGCPPQNHWLATDRLTADPDRWTVVPVDVDQPAFLQYTSGSTSTPKGVIVTHGNLAHNLETITEAFDLDPNTDRGVIWLPNYHDMGLIGGLLMPLFVAVPTEIFPPATFLRRPLRWLQAMSDGKATITGGPNFAYEVCLRKVTDEQLAGFDLSSWRLAFCGAEPVRASTLEAFARRFARCGFQPEAFFPCYGLAESTLFVTGGHCNEEPRLLTVDSERLTQHTACPVPASDPTAQTLVSCGVTRGDQLVRIVDATSGIAKPDGEVGEIWVQGPSVAQGFWNAPDASREAFQARLAGHAGHFLRTGDLGFIYDGELYVTGRIKDLIIIRGRNLYPQDLERTVDTAHTSVGEGSAVFAVETPTGEAAVAISEIRRGTPETAHDAILTAIRNQLVAEHEIAPEAVVLIRPGSLPRTTSGKVQRFLSRERYLSGELSTVAIWSVDRSPSEEIAEVNGNGHASQLSDAVSAAPIIIAPTNGVATEAQIEAEARSIERQMLRWLVDEADVPTESVDRQKPFAEYGLDSMTALEMIGHLEEKTGVTLGAVAAWNYPTPAALARHLAERRLGVSEPLTDSEPEPDAAFPRRTETDPDTLAALAAQMDADELEALLAEIEREEGVGDRG